MPTASLLLLVSLSPGPAVQAADRLCSSYQLIFSGSGSLQLPDPTGKKSFSTTIRTKVDGTLEIFPSGNHEFIAQFRPSALSVIQDGQVLESPSRKFAQEISRPLELIFDQKGALVHCRFSSLVSEGTKNLTLSLLSYLQFSSPDNVTFRPTTRTESGRLGLENVRYRRLSSGPNLLLESREILGYQASHSGKPAGASTHTRGKYRIELDRKAPFPILTCRGESRDDSFMGSRPSGVSRANFSIIRITTKNLTQKQRSELAAEKQALAGAPLLTLDYKPSREIIETSIQRKQLGQTTPAELLQKLGSMGNSEMKGQNLSDLYLKVAALFYLQPSQVFEFGKLMISSDPKSAVYQLVERALGSVGNPQCQRFVEKTISESIDHFGTCSVLVATCSRFESPDRETIHFLTKLSSDSQHPQLADMSTMALGAIARNLSKISPSDAKAIRLQLKERLDQSRDVYDERLMLTALGNAGGQEALDSGMKFLKSSDPEIRSTAISTLRFADAPFVTDLMVYCLQTDPIPAVRESAAVNLGSRPRTSKITIALADSLGDSSESVRYRCLGLLSNYPKTQRVRMAIEKVAIGDRDANLRRAADQMLH